MHRSRHVVTVAVACLLVLVSGGVAHAAPATPTLVGIRAAHHPTFDRIVFDFRNGVPAGHQAQYVTQLTGDASGLPVPVAGRAVLRIRFSPAQAHDAAGHVTAPARVAFGLPNMLMTVRSGDFEAVTTYGIGLAARQPFHVFTLSSPPRVVVDVNAAFRTVQRKVYFLDPARFATGTEPYFRPVLRPVLPLTPATGVMDRLFAGPTPAEQARGLRFLASGATGFQNLSIRDRIARVQLTGGCSSGGSTATIAGEIFPTLRQFPSVDVVKIFDPAGTTGTPAGHRDSIPNCLEP
ncbi:MAG TPA: GerMN domain-containing protein [Blastococcus sp.]|nr:GerMN domain-containing protein [Blastococcus sp.]